VRGAGGKFAKDTAFAPGVVVIEADNGYNVTVMNKGYPYAFWIYLY